MYVYVLVHLHEYLVMLVHDVVCVWLLDAHAIASETYKVCVYIFCEY